MLTVKAMCRVAGLAVALAVSGCAAPSQVPDAPPLPYSVFALARYQMISCAKDGFMAREVAFAGLGYIDAALFTHRFDPATLKQALDYSNPPEDKLSAASCAALEQQVIARQSKEPLEAQRAWNAIIKASPNQRPPFCDIDIPGVKVLSCF